MWQLHNEIDGDSLNDITMSATAINALNLQKHKCFQLDKRDAVMSLWPLPDDGSETFSFTPNCASQDLAGLEEHIYKCTVPTTVNAAKLMRKHFVSCLVCDSISVA